MTEPEREPAPLLPGEKPSRISGTARWVIVCAVVALALAVAIWPRSGGDTAAPPPSGAPSTSVSPGQLQAARAKAALAPCVTGGTARGPLAGLRLDCLGDGAPLDAGALPDGLPTLVNVWAWWCAPCRVELPAMAEIASRGAGKLTVLSVHADPNPAAALDLLSELRLTLPTVEDPQAKVATLLGAPRVYPATILLRADGSVASVHARPFTSADDVAATVRADLGVDL
ncbi:TlpA disulfide reductase family protein [Tsukamurella strandjordii]|uniref:TlpA family protein disulfide reductase n=1 Tax=Tsukamurella strandjordii TaxID=147577 RepID=UPI0031E00B47